MASPPAPMPCSCRSTAVTAGRRRWIRCSGPLWRPARRRRVWLVETRAWESDPGGLLRRWLVNHGRAIDQQTWPGMELRLFEVPGESGGAADPKLEA